jgi:preprotein translocase subunit SecG
MTTVLLLIHLFVTIALIGVVLIQRSEGGGLGIGTSQGMGAFMSGRGTANLLTRTTAILAAAFFGLSLALALINKGTGGVGRSILDIAPASAPAPAAGTLPPLAPGHAPTAGAPSAPPSTPATGVPTTEPAPAAPATKPAAPGVPTN